MRKIKMINFSIFSFIFIFACSFVVYAETIKLISGETVEGKVVEETFDYIRIIDKDGFLHKYNIEDIEDVESVKQIENVVVDEESSRYFNEEEDQQEYIKAPQKVLDKALDNYRKMIDQYMK